MSHPLTVCFLATLMALAASSAFAHPDARHSLDEIDEHLAAMSGNPQLHLTKAGILLGIGHVAEAVRCVDEAARLAPDAPGIGYMEARLFFAVGDAGAARRRLDAFLNVEPQHVEGLRLACKLAADAKDMDAAIRRGLALQNLSEAPAPDDVGRCATLYLHRRQPGDDQLALNVIDAGLARLGGLTGLHYMACDIEIRLARYDAALARLALLSAHFRPRIEFEVKRAEILGLAGRKAAAAQAYDNAVLIMDAYPRERQRSEMFQRTRKQFVTKRDDLRQSVSQR